MAPAMTPATFKNFTFSLVFSLHVFGYASCIHTLDAVLCSSIFGKLSLVGAILKCAAKKEFGPATFEAFQKLVKLRNFQNWFPARPKSNTFLEFRTSAF